MDVKHPSDRNARLQHAPPATQIFVKSRKKFFGRRPIVYKINIAPFPPLANQRPIFIFIFLILIFCVLLVCR